MRRKKNPEEPAKRTRKPRKPDLTGLTLHLKGGRKFEYLRPGTGEKPMSNLLLVTDMMDPEYKFAFVCGSSRELASMIYSTLQEHPDLKGMVMGRIMADSLASLLERAKGGKR